MALISVLAIVSLKLLFGCHTLLHWVEWCPSKIYVPPDSQKVTLSGGRVLAYAMSYLRFS